MVETESSNVDDNWPFDDPWNVATFTQRQIMDGSAPILLVCHDPNDGTWQFLNSSLISMADTRIVALA